MVTAARNSFLSALLGCVHLGACTWAGIALSGSDSGLGQVRRRSLVAGASSEGRGVRVNTAFKRIRPAVCCLTAGALMLAQVPMAQAASAMTRADYEACQAREETGFRAAIEQLTLRGLEAGLADVDYKALVAEEWRRGNIDDLIDREVDRAIG